MKGCIAAVNKVIQLTLNIIQQCGRSHAEQVRLGPLVAELVFHQSKPHQCVLGAADTSSRLEADFEVGSLVIITNGTDLKTVEKIITACLFWRLIPCRIQSQKLHSRLLSQWTS